MEDTTVDWDDSTLHLPADADGLSLLAASDGGGSDAPHDDRAAAGWSNDEGHHDKGAAGAGGGRGDPADEADDGDGDAMWGVGVAADDPYDNGDGDEFSWAAAPAVGPDGGTSPSPADDDGGFGGGGGHGYPDDRWSVGTPAAHDGGGSGWAPAAGASTFYEQATELGRGSSLPRG